MENLTNSYEEQAHGMRTDEQKYSTSLYPPELDPDCSKNKIKQLGDIMYDAAQYSFVHGSLGNHYYADAMMDLNTTYLCPIVQPGASGSDPLLPPFEYPTPIPTPHINNDDYVLDNLNAGQVGVNNTNLLDAFFEAIDYVMGPNGQTLPTAITIAEAFGILGYGDAFNPLIYHGDVYDHQREILIYAINQVGSSSGLQVTSTKYNELIAKNYINESVRFPASKRPRFGVKIIGNSLGDIAPPNSEYYPLQQVVRNISIDYDSPNFYYVPNVENTLSDVHLTTQLYYNESDNKLYQNVSFLNYVPDGFYWLPEEHPDVFERNNFLIHIVNGQIESILK